jgi:nucleotide-binding universal stress UspA family protein
MYLSLLVPLDRSSFAEQALPLALSIARRANARLDLVEVHALYALKEPASCWVSYEPDRDAECKQQEQLYLDGTAKWISSVSPVSVAAIVLSGSAALPETVVGSILERARDGNTDLIVMATHGRDPLSRFGLGSVGDELIRRAPVPVLLVRPTEEIPRLIPEPALENVLVPLDGSVLAEQALEPALDLARLMAASCTLLRVVEPSDAILEGLAEEEARAYLEKTIARYGQQEILVKGITVVAPSVPEAILRLAPANGVIALATHGRGGFKRFILGSVADKVLRGSSIPVLVCHRNARGE